MLILPLNPPIPAPRLLGAKTEECYELLRSTGLFTLLLLTKKGRRQTAESFYGRVSAQLPVCLLVTSHGAGVVLPLPNFDLVATKLGWV